MHLCVVEYECDSTEMVDVRSECVVDKVHTGAATATAFLSGIKIARALSQTSVLGVEADSGLEVIVERTGSFSLSNPSQTSRHPQRREVWEAVGLVDCALAARAIPTGQQ